MYNKYPYTDFHELNLDWFLAQFKELVEAWDAQKVDYNQFKLDVTTEFNTLSGKFDTLEETVQTFTTFVENYFENLDVQQEIDHKLDELAADGTLSTLLAPLVDDKLPAVVDVKLGAVVTDQLPGVVTDQLPGVVEDQIDDAVDPKVPVAVTDWLEENVNPVGSAIVVDATLSISGAAADALVTGSKISGVQDEVGVGKYLNFTDTFASNTFVEIAFPLVNGKSYRLINTGSTTLPGIIYGRTGNDNQQYRGSQPIAPGQTVIFKAVRDDDKLYMYFTAGTFSFYITEFANDHGIYSELDNDVYPAINDIDTKIGVGIYRIDSITLGSPDWYEVAFPIKSGMVFFFRNTGEVRINCNNIYGRTNGVVHPLQKNIELQPGEFTILPAAQSDDANLYIYLNAGNNGFEIMEIKDYSIYHDIADLISDMDDAQDDITQLQSDVGGLQNDVNGILHPAQPQVMFVGDSQTQRHTFVDKFSSLYSDSVVTYYGYGGQKSDTIAMAQGGYPMYVKPFTIPAATTPVQIQLASPVIGDFISFTQSYKGLTAVNISGVIGSITYDSGHNYFTRAASGTAVTVSRPVLVKSTYYDDQGSILIIEVGTNDSYNQTLDDFIPKLENAIDAIIKHNGSDKYIVLGLTAKVYCSDIADANKLLAAKFGDHFLDIRQYLLDYGLADAGITPTAQDTTDISNGEIPTSLRDDAVHFNQAGGNVIGQQIYNYGKLLGYWS